MHLSEDYLIKQALLTVGDVTGYNDTASRIYVAAKDKLEAVVREVCESGSFNFNGTTTTLTTTIRDSATGEYRFNKPADYCGFKTMPKKMMDMSDRPMDVYADIRYLDATTIRIEGDYVYSNKSEIAFSYNRYVPLQDIEPRIGRYIYLNLAKALCSMYEMFARKLDAIIIEIRTEKAQLQAKDGQPNNMVVM